MGEYMKKLKDIWYNNRILILFSVIILICIIVISVVCVNMFFGGNKSPYGERLDGMENYPFTEEEKTAVVDKLTESDTVLGVDVHSQGKIIYIRIQFQNVTLDRAKEIANTALEVISEEDQSVYDIHFTLVSDASETSPGFTLMGAKNINRSIVIWNNNNPMPSTSEGE